MNFKDDDTRTSLALCWWLAMAIVGCGAASRYVGPTRVPAPGRGASHYRAQPSAEDAQAGPTGDALFDRALQRAMAAGGRGLQRDRRLDRLAQASAAHWRTYQSAPSLGALSFLTQHLGLPEPPPHLALLSAPAGALVDHIEREIAPMVEAGRYTHVGLHIERQALTARAVVILSFRHFQPTKPIPRHLQVGGRFTLTGQLSDDHSHPNLVLVDPQGGVTRTSLGRGRDVALTSHLNRQGTYQVELLAQGAHGLTVVANFPVYVGVPAPRSYAGYQRLPAALAPKQTAIRLLDLVNEARARQDLPPLVADASARRVAKAHNDDMLVNHFVGHRSPRTGNVLDRVQHAKLPTSVVLENIGRDYTPQALHDGWMGSPGHRANLLHPDVTHIGIDVQASPGRGDGPTALLATQVFIRRQPPLPAAPEQLVLSAINDARRSGGLAALPMNEQLSAPCKAAAQAYFKAPRTQGEPATTPLLKGLQAQLVRLAPGRRIATSMQLLSNLTEVAQDPHLLSSQIRSLGLGVAQGPHGPSGDEAVVVMVALELGSPAR